MSIAGVECLSLLRAASDSVHKKSASTYADRVFSLRLRGIPRAEVFRVALGPLSARGFQWLHVYDVTATSSEVFTKRGTVVGIYVRGCPHLLDQWAASDFFTPRVWISAGP